MTAGELAAVIVAVAVVILVVALIAAFVQLSRTLGLLRSSIEELRGEALPLVRDARATVAQANAELLRVDELMGTAESIGATVDSASRLAYLAFSNPVVKLMALGAGVGRAGRRLRRSRAAG